MTVSGETLEAPPQERLAARRPGFGVSLALLAVLGAAFQLWFIQDNWDRGIYDGLEYSINGDITADGYGWVAGDSWYFEGVIRQAGVHPPFTRTWHALISLAGGEGVWRHQLGELPLGVLLVVVLGLLGRAVAGERAGLFAALAAAVHPGIWTYPASAMAETPSQLWLALALVAAYAWRQRPTPLRIGVVAGCGAMAALTRSEMLAVLLVLLAGLLLGPRVAGLRHRVVHGVAAAAWAGVLLGPWILYNQVRFEPPVLWNTGFDITLVSSNCPAAYAGPLKGYWSLSCRPQISPVDSNGDPVDESAVAVLYREVATNRIDAHRDQLPGVIVARLGRTFSLGDGLDARLSSEGALEGRHRPALVASVLAYYLTLPLAAVGWWQLRRRRQAAWPLIVPALLAAIATSITTHGTTRYRIGVDLGLIVLTGVALDLLTRRSTWASGAQRRAASQADA